MAFLFGIFAFFRVVLGFCIKYVFKAIAIGFIGFLFISAGWKTWVHKDPDYFMKEFGGRILMVDRTIQEKLDDLKAQEKIDIKKNVVTYLSIILDILMFFYIIKFIMWTLGGIVGPTVPSSIYLMIAIGIIFFAEMFYAKVYLGHWIIPFMGFISMVTHIFDLLIMPIVEWLKAFLHISEIPAGGNESLTWWDRLFL